MIDMYRVMIEVGNGTTFCYDSHLTEHEATEAIGAARTDYPEAIIWVELMTND